MHTQATYFKDFLTIGVVLMRGSTVVNTTILITFSIRDNNHCKLKLLSGIVHCYGDKYPSTDFFLTNIYLTYLCIYHGAVICF